MEQIDLHVHSNASDGTYTPTEVILTAKQAELSAIALTDHDTVAGIKEAKEAAKIINAELVVTKKNVTGESGTVVANYTAKLVFNSNSNVDGYEGGKEITITTPEDEIIQTGAEGNMTYVFVGAFVVLAAAAFVVASSFKKASSK